MEVKTKIRYRWKAEPTACETCRKLDGTEYNSTNQIPKRPHPNCRCVIEPIEEVEKGYEDVERIERIEKEIDELKGDLRGLFAELTKMKNEVEELKEEGVYPTDAEDAALAGQEVNEIYDECVRVNKSVESFSNKFKYEEKTHGLSKKEIAEYENGVVKHKSLCMNIRNANLDFAVRLESYKARKTAEQEAYNAQNKPAIDLSKADEYKTLAAEADDLIKGRLEAPSNGWRVVDTTFNRESNFKAVTYEKGNEIVIDFVGTDFKFTNTVKGDFGSVKDLGANAKMVVNLKTRQMDEARRHCQKIKKEYPDKKITVIGHSEGGSEAIFAGVFNGLDVMTINAFGVSDKLLPEGYDKSRITNFRVDKDPVSAARPPQGKILVINGTGGPKNRHGINNMGDLRDAVLKAPKSRVRWSRKRYF